ncbi:DUF4197 domain-containing protein [Rapidithrix thailandica]|uniref:DUF4197 domain-containing protein n=1 Tax=Rapidithrix thailandica TaxID=413964 RepID=A0AAW9SAH6_9BACT
MKSTIFVLFLFFISVQASEAQFLKDLFGGGGKSSSNISEKEAEKGIKDALLQGIKKGVDNVSEVDGYFKNTAIKIPFPDNVKKVETQLRALGMNEMVDKAILSMNRAAEQAAKDATPIFVSAIKQLTIQDALNIVTGQQEDAATQYLQRTTSDSLTRVFKPTISAALENVNATKYWDDVFTRYNKIPFIKKVNPNLEEYVTEKAIEGLFHMVAKEEKLIRKDPVARTTDLLKKVFGGK